LSDINKNFWNEPISNLIKDLNSNEKGLSQTEATSRLKTLGANEISSGRQTVVFYQLLRRFMNPLVLLLLITSLVSLMLGQTNDFIIILVIITLSVGLDFYQEYSANQAAKKLKESIGLQAQVLRGGSLQTIPVKEIVPGDVVYLSAGSMVPADGRVLWENHLFINQSALTGESFPV
jgi:Mg2+-importing ATPase